VLYSERLRVPAAWWLITAAGLVTLWVVIVVAAGNIVATAVTAVAALACGALLLSYGAAAVQVDSETLTAGRARIERAHLGAVEPLTGEAARRARGVECDARAYLLLRPYVPHAVRVEITDPADPAPYWLIATRHPDRLASVLGTGQWQDRH
jgi:predicted RNA methylase